MSGALISCDAWCDAKPRQLCKSTAHIEMHALSNRCATMSAGARREWSTYAENEAPTLHIRAVDAPHESTSSFCNYARAFSHYCTAHLPYSARVRLASLCTETRHDKQPRLQSSRASFGSSTRTATQILAMRSTFRLGRPYLQRDRLTRERRQV